MEQAEVPYLGAEEELREQDAMGGEPERSFAAAFDPHESERGLRFIENPATITTGIDAGNRQANRRPRFCMEL